MPARSGERTFNSRATPTMSDYRIVRLMQAMVDFPVRDMVRVTVTGRKWKRLLGDLGPLNEGR
jgi:hypothetical protein